MSGPDQDKKLDELLELIKKAPVLNGGFTKLSDAIHEIQECNTKVLFELQIMKTTLNTNTEKLSDVRQSLYDPDQGLYRRVTTALEVNDQQTEEIKEVTQKTEVLSKKVAIIETKNSLLEAKNPSLELVAGKDLSDLRETISAKKNFSKAAWAFAIAIIGGLIKVGWDILSNVF